MQAVLNDVQALRMKERQKKILSMLENVFSEAKIISFTESYAAEHGKRWDGIWKAIIRNYNPRGEDVVVHVEPSDSLMTEANNAFDDALEEAARLLKRIFSTSRYNGRVVRVREYRGEWGLEE